MSTALHHLATSSGVLFGTSGARGLVAQMSDGICYAYAQAFMRAVAAGANRVVIGHDLRPSSPTMAAACAQAVADAGMDVVFVGPMPTPGVAFYAASLRAPAIIITGSHIPFDRNGIKFYRADGEISKADEQAMLESDVELPADLANRLASQPLPAIVPDALSAYLDRYIEFFGRGALHGKRVAIYEHSSVARDILRSVLESLGAAVISLGRTDSFVPIDTEAVRPEDVAQAKQWAAEHQFDAILSTDGDADRPLIGDEQGNWLRGDVVGILCAQYLGANVVVTPVSSNTAVEKCGAFQQVIRTRIGSPYVIAGMEMAYNQTSQIFHAAQNSGNPMPIVVGYEANGGFLLGSDVIRNGKPLAALPTRDAILPMLALLCMARERRYKLSELSQHLPKRFTASDRLQAFPTQESQALMDRLLHDPIAASALLAPQSGEATATDTTDGLRITFNNGDIVHLRPSGNAPELRCYAEAYTVNNAEILCNTCLGRIRQEQK